MGDLKRLLIVDDSDIDREILRDILEDEFELLEADNGYDALALIKKEKSINAVFLDIAMPILDGLEVLRILRENDRNNISVFMITSEATKDNLEKAFHYHIDDFIRKPFDRKDILNRVCTRLGVAPKEFSAQDDSSETRRYISDLQQLYNSYLYLSGRDAMRDERRECFMQLLLEKWNASGKTPEYNRFDMELLCKAAYLCNIGEMLAPKPSGEGTSDDAIYQQHTELGAKILQLNYAKNCKRFVQLCSDICLHHHERYDGKGYPRGTGGSHLSVQAQLCGLLERFDDLFFPYSRHNAMQFDYVISQLRNDTGAFSEGALSLLEQCKDDIIAYYAVHQM